jgi:hypothetical protein
VSKVPVGSAVKKPRFDGTEWAEQPHRSSV